MLPRNRVHPSKLSKKHPVWVQKAVKGHFLMRDGVDYINNGHRYDTAHVLLTEAYNEASAASSATAIDLARICLWNGITLNENYDLDKVIANTEAIKWYKKGLKHLKDANDNPLSIPIMASLFNSMGVAHHHKLLHKAPKGIPAVALRNYTRSRDIFRDHPDMKRQLARVMRKVESNTGRLVMRGGCQNCDEV